MLHPDFPNYSFKEKDEDGVTDKGLPKEYFHKDSVYGRFGDSRQVATLKNLLEKVVVKSNGLSIWVRMDHGEKLPDRLKDDLRALYKLQLEIEDSLNMYGLKELKEEPKSDIEQMWDTRKKLNELEKKNEK